MPEKQPDHKTGTLYVVATPIGNLEDITLRAIKTLKQVNLIAAEDTRHTQRLLKAHDIEGRLISYHEHNEQSRTPELLERLKQGASIALVSDAGTPAVSDPGYRLVQASTAEKIPIVPIPGVSAAVTALSAAGLATDNFTFAGFPLRKKNKRLQQLKLLADLPHTLVFYQSPRRIIALLEEIKTIMGDRQAVLARELTKIHEEFIPGTLSEIIETLNQRSKVKGECTLLVAGAEDIPISETDMEKAITLALAESNESLSDMAKNLAKKLKVPRKKVYDKALQLQKKRANNSNKVQ